MLQIISFSASVNLGTFLNSSHNTDWSSRIEELDVEDVPGSVDLLGEVVGADFAVPLWNELLFVT
jgi:hypothetical protein